MDLFKRVMRVMAISCLDVYSVSSLEEHFCVPFLPLFLIRKDRRWLEIGIRKLRFPERR